MTNFRIALVPLAMVPLLVLAAPAGAVPARPQDTSGEATRERADCRELGYLRRMQGGQLSAGQARRCAVAHARRVAGTARPD